MPHTILPLLPLRNIVVFPSMTVPLFVGRDKSIAALEAVGETDQEILLITQMDSDLEDPKPEDLYKVGCLGNVLQMLKLPDGTVKILVEGLRRVHIKRILEDGDFMQAELAEFPDVINDNNEVKALRRTVTDQFSEYAKVENKISVEAIENMEKITDPSKLADVVAQSLDIKIADKQKILEAKTLDKRLELIFGFMRGEMNILNVEKRIRKRVKNQMEKTQREYYLNEQIKAIQKELGDEGEGKSELEILKERITKTKFSKEALAKAESELKKLSHMSPMSSEATVIRNYLDWLLDIPWDINSELKGDLKTAEAVLDKEHYGLEKVKERILEYLAVLSRTGKIRGQVLCLVGPPGVGKTSLGQSIATATNREFVRMSLGGVHDEAEIRGHRRTYIGSLPGRIIQGMKKAGTCNPLFLLDEIDKLGADHRGDPASALLEVLDPEQNSTFNDHYLEVDYDLSNAMFVTTANSLRIPGPLRDRMEVIVVPGYTEEEKMEIAKGYLIPKQLELHGLKKKEWKIKDSAIQDLIRYYTREAGVRGLERQLARLNRKAVRKIVSGELKSVAVDNKNLEKIIGVRQFKFGVAEDTDLVGVVNGLAWTEVGGDILMIESVLVGGNGTFSKTGKLGTVMQESISAAEFLVKSRAAEFGISKAVMLRNNVHIHVPEGSVPKEGPSAGVAMVTSVVSSLTGIPVRRDVAMTGEITLRGRVLQIGGLKEKILAAKRAGIKKILIPIDNEKDLKEMAPNILKGVKIVPVETVDEVLRHALKKRPIAVSWEEEERQAAEAMQTQAAVNKAVQDAASTAAIAEISAQKEVSKKKQGQKRKKDSDKTKH